MEKISNTFSRSRNNKNAIKGDVKPEIFVQKKMSMSIIEVYEIGKEKYIYIHIHH